MASTSTRPWYRLHVLTIVALSLVVGAATYAQTLASLESLFGGSGGFHTIKEYGWPLDHVRVHEIEYLLEQRTPPSTYEYHWRYLPLAGNIVLSLALVASTVLVIERWLRSPKRWQLSLGTYLGFVMTCGVLITVLNGTIESMLDSVDPFSIDRLTWSSLRSPLRWPLLFALGCTIYTVGWLVWASSHRLLARLHRDR